MEKFIADFHVHSRFSMATSKDLNLESLYVSAQQKGIAVVGTGDFTHPGWFSEIVEKLVPEESGLFQLRQDLASQCDKTIPKSCRNKVRFILTAEISNIYKKAGKTRKNHNLIFVPDLDSARRMINKLKAIGNISSDGRPILGLDAKHLLEILLEQSEKAFLIPAHIWTPWFSLLGSKSGFDSVEECFEDLTSHIFALETGLSSDPAMNWRVSQLDRYTLVSNSDAHSAKNLGREANIFCTNMSYGAILSALKSGDPEKFPGTFEFYPEEGKYHFDGHRKCGIVLHPKESLSMSGNCPVCGKPLTLGVLHRVEALADRSENEPVQKSCSFSRMVPLAQILSEVLKVGPNTKKVHRTYLRLLEHLGPELGILQTMDIDSIRQLGIPLLAEAVSRMRSQQIFIRPGFDGEFGKIQIFNEQERERFLSQKPLFQLPHSAEQKHADKFATDKLKKTYPDPQVLPKKVGVSETLDRFSRPIKIKLNSYQKEAVEYGDGPMLIIAGPGTGKTRTLTHRIAYIIEEKKVSPENILAVTFTNKAAEEMKIRLRKMLGKSAFLPEIGTFHAICYKILKDNQIVGFQIADDQQRTRLAEEAVAIMKSEGEIVEEKVSTLIDWVISAKQRLVSPENHSDSFVPQRQKDTTLNFYRNYQSLLEKQGLLDFEDLIFKTVDLMDKEPSISRQYRKRFRYIFVDEYQDLNFAQYKFIRSLYSDSKTDRKRGLCVIGDPNQAIYGFRGADVKFFQKFLSDYPAAKIIYLSRNYRSTQTILKAAHQMIQSSNLLSVYSKIQGAPQFEIIETVSEISEAETVARSIEKLVGGSTFFSIDSGKTDGYFAHEDLGFSDIAVLFRTHGQIKVFAEVFEKRGIPYQTARKTDIYEKTGLGALISLFRLFSDVTKFIDAERIILYILKDYSKKTLKRILSLTDIVNMPVDRQIEQFLKNAGRHKIGKPASEALNALLTVKDEFLKAQTLEDKLRYLAQLPYFETDYNRYYDIYENLFLKSTAYDRDSIEFLTGISLETDKDELPKNTEKVALMSIHAAKGLEFEAVFVCGCEAGFIPYKGFGGFVENLSEERRLFYVAMTRAKKTLFLTWANRRQIYGKYRSRELSPFVDDIQKALKKLEKPFSGKKKDSGQIQMSLF